MTLQSYTEQKIKEWYDKGLWKSNLRRQQHFLTTAIEGAAKIVEQNKKVEIQEALHRYSDWLLKHGYTDADIYAEPPHAVDRFLQDEPK